MQFEVNQEPECIKQIIQENEKNACMLHLTNQQREGLFTNAIIAYEQLNKRAEKIIVKIAIKEWSTETRKYAKK